MKRTVVILLCAALAVAGCGCKKEDVGTVISDVKETVEDTVALDNATSGFIEVELPYQELFGTDHLTRITE